MARIGKKLKMKRFKQAICDIRRNRLPPRVFDLTHRTDESPMKNRETDFAFYNRSCRAEITRVRKFIEDSLSNYPKSELNDLISRVRSGDNQLFRSAIFELILHESLLRQGFTLEPHPELLNGSLKRPDFLVTDRDGNQFYLEAVLAKEINEQDVGGEARKGVIFDALNDNPHHNFTVDVDDDGYPKTQPSGKKLVVAVHRWLDGLDPDELQQYFELERWGDIESFQWSHEDWVVNFRPIPIKRDRRGKSKQLIGMIGGGGLIDQWSPIRDAIKSKGNRYGRLDKPLVVAVNFDSFHLERIDEMQALYGQEQYVIEMGRGDQEPRMERAANGAWHGGGGPQYTRVSGAWIFSNVKASSFTRSGQTLYHNPWAISPLPESLNCFPHAAPQEDRIHWVEGLSLAEVFGLSVRWPE